MLLHKVKDLGGDATLATPRSQNADRAQQRGRALLRERGGGVHVNLRGNCIMALAATSTSRWLSALNWQRQTCTEYEEKACNNVNVTATQEINTRLSVLVCFQGTA